LLDSGVEEVSSDFSYGFNELTLSVNTPDGVPVDAYQRQVYFPIEDYLIAITLSAPESSYEEVLLEFNSIMETVQFLK
jgi:hypothetical protein